MKAIRWRRLPARLPPSVPVDHHVDVADYFDAESDHYAEAYASDTHVGLFFRTRRTLVAGLLDLLPRGTVLDVGCGPGVMAPTCRSLGFRYHGVDISAAMVATANRLNAGAAGVSFVCGSATDLPVADASHDVVLCLGVLEYLEPGEVRLALAESVRVLDADGVLIVSCLNGHSPMLLLRRLHGRLRRWLARPISDDHMIERLGARDIRRLIEDAGYRITWMRGYGYSPVPAHIHDRHPRLWARVTHRLEWLASTPLAWTALGYLVMAVPVVPSK